MKKRILLNMLLLIFINLLFVSAALCLVFYQQFSDTVVRELHSLADAFAETTSQTATLSLSDIKSAEMRITIVRPDGTVAYDNAAQAETMSNHSDRAEIRDAFTSGIGQSKRFSDTLQEETIYYAVRLADGYVLRIAETSSSILGVFVGILPVVAGIVLVMGVIGNLLAGRLTKRIVAPINNVNLESELTPPYDELTPFVRTIEEQREHIAWQFTDLQSRADTINAIMENMNEGILLLNGQGIILSANKSALRIFERNAPIDGMNILGFLRDTDFLAHVRAALDGKPGEMRMERAGRVYRVYFSYVKGNGTIILFLDTTEKAKAEKLRREFSANVSHELKTPLTSIYGNAEMLAGGIVKENDKHAFCIRIRDEAERLIALIEDILMLSKLDEGSGQESFEDIELFSIACETVEALSRKAAESDITVQVSGEGIHMKAGRSLIYEMFYNLIDNAIKYNKPGGRVLVDITNASNQIVITVSDSGIGIPREAQSRVFERFYRVDQSRSRKTGGTGLGLAIVKHIAAAHGGKVVLDSRENEGTTVIVTFSD